MPDFSLEGSLDFWKNYDDPNVYKVIKFMETIEDWTLDGAADVELALSNLENSMEELSGVEISNFDMLVKLGAYLKTSRVLRIMQEIDSQNPGAASRLLGFAENASTENDAAQLFIRRNLIFERLRLLSRIFDPKRLNTLQAALEKIS